MVKIKHWAILLVMSEVSKYMEAIGLKIASSNYLQYMYKDSNYVNTTWKYDKIFLEKYDHHPYLSYCSSWYSKGHHNP